MRPKAKRLVTTASCAIVLAFGTLVFADHKWDGTYDLGKWGFGQATTAALWLHQEQDGSYSATRKSDESVLHGSGNVRADGWLNIQFADAKGASGTLNTIGNATAQQTTGGWYKVTEDGQVYGYFQGTDASGARKWVFEYGKKGADRPNPLDSADDPADPVDDPADPVDDPADDTDLAVDGPAAGNYLVGQTVDLELSPSDAELTIDGPAERDGDTLKITGVGDITLTATKDGEASDEVVLTALQVEVTEITVLNTIEITDAKPPHFSRDLGAEEDASETTPAAIFKDTKLKLQIKLSASENLSETAKIKLSVSALHVNYEGEVELKNLADGQVVTIESDEVLSEKVAINAFSLDVLLGEQSVGMSWLRIYTSYKAPIKNISRDVSEPNTVLHFEKACQWANGAGQNIGNGADSIGYQIDNQMRHFVHWDDLGSFEPAVADYPQGAGKQKNYKDLPGSWRFRDGNRAVSSLYYPPLEPDEDYEKYTNYRNNFGWWVLDNPDYTGGRCNQQAALVCGILGTVGIEAELLYLERTARGKNSGRPMRNYFYANDGSADGSGPWNFHGVAVATLGDGSEWIYDGSFSSPPRRKNGTREWAQNGGGPFLLKWGPWYYTDWRKGTVPASDIPHSNTWKGLPLAANEAEPGEVSVAGR